MFPHYTENFEKLLLKNDIKTGIIKTDTSDHFPIFIVSSKPDIDVYSTDNFIFKRYINDETMNNFKNKLNEINWENIKNIECPESAYNLFLQQFSAAYENAFPKVKIKIKIKNLLSPWISKGILKSSKKKQKLYDKYLKNRTYKNEKNYKTYKNMFETVKFKSKKNYYNNLITKYKNNIKKTWSIMKEAIGKMKQVNNNLPRRLIINNKEIYAKKTIAESFNNYFINVGPNLASKIPPCTEQFDSYLKPNNHVLEESVLSDKEFKTAFFSLKTNKSAGNDEISYNVVKHVFQYICEPLKHIFQISLTKGIVPNKLKIARVTPVFKAGEVTDVSNYRPISVLPCFSKILERIMYNRLFSYLDKNDILYNKQFGFQKANSTDHAIIQLIDQLVKSFNDNKFTIGVFIDLSKAFDTVDHQILLGKLKHYGITGNNLKWFHSYLSNRKQFIKFNQTEESTLLNIKCGVPQGSILGPLLFLLYVNDLCEVSNILEPIMFADDTNLFYSHKNLKTLFNIVNIELNKLNNWFKSNKLSLNTGKTKYTFFHKLNLSDNIPLQLPELKIHNTIIKRERATKFLGIIIDENLTWKNHIELIESKVAKNIGMLYKAKFILNKKCLRDLYFAFIHSYLSYANIGWASTNPNKLKKLYNKQKHAARIICNEDRLAHAKPLMKSLKILNIYQVNIFQTLNFMQKTKLNQNPKLFSQTFQPITHKYPTKYAENNFLKPKSKLKISKYSVSIRGPTLWNDFLHNKTKSLTSLPMFQSAVKNQLFDSEEEINYF